jgi:hypothetical protein
MLSQTAFPWISFSIPWSILWRAKTIVGLSRMGVIITWSVLCKSWVWIPCASWPLSFKPCADQMGIQVLFSSNPQDLASSLSNPLGALIPSPTLHPSSYSQALASIHQIPSVASHGSPTLSLLSLSFSLSLSLSFSLSHTHTHTHTHTLINAKQRCFFLQIDSLT